jgi:hypothetical protein
MNKIIKARRVAAVALAVAVVPFAASTASAAPHGHHHAKRVAKSVKAAMTSATTTSTPAPASAPVTSVIAIGGYVFYNMTYLEAVEAWQAAVAAAPAGYTPPPVTSVSVSTTVGGTVDPGNG